MSIKNITNLVDFSNSDDECLPITKCVCGNKFDPWDFIISIYDDEEYIIGCPECGAKLYFRNAVQVYQIIKD